MTHTSACKKCGKMFDPSPFQLDCDECSMSFAQKMMAGLDLKSDNNWEVSQEAIDAADNLKIQNAVNVSKLKGLIHD